MARLGVELASVLLYGAFARDAADNRAQLGFIAENVLKGNHAVVNHIGRLGDPTSDLECAVMRKFYILLALCASILFAPSRGGAQAPERFRVRLTTVPMD